jgi:hypothetical protein
VSEWHKIFKEAQKVRMQKSRVKTTLTEFFFYAKGIIHHEFVPEKQTVNCNFYKEAIKRLIARVHRVWLEFQEFCTTMHRPILRALFLSIWRNEGSPRYLIHPTPLI